MKNLVIAILSTSFLVACGESTESTDSVATVQFALTPSSAGQGVSSVALNVRDLEFDLPMPLTCADVEDQLVGARCELEDSPETSDDNPSLAKIVIDGPMNIDLRNTQNPLEGISIPDLAYSRLDIRIESQGGYSILVEKGGQEYLFDFNEDIRFESPSGVRVTGGPILVEFDAAAWLHGVDVDSCTDEDSCDEVEDQLKDNLKNAGQLR